MRRSRGGALLGAVVVAACGARTPLLVGDVTTDASDGGVDARDAGDSIAIDAPDTLVDEGVDVPVVECPTFPTSGERCGPAGVVCAYARGKTCSGATGGVAFRCEADGWLEIAHCIDPTTCPSAAPTEGTACDSVGLDCFYSNARACAASGIVQCTAATGWRYVNDCGGRTLATRICHLTPSLATDAQQTLFDEKGTIADRAALQAIGTQIASAYVLTPELGGEEQLDRRLFQSAVPAMSGVVPVNPFGPYRGDSIASLDRGHLQLAMAWGSSEASLAGAFVAVGPFDAPTTPGATRLDRHVTEAASVALSAQIVPDGSFDLYGWVVYRHALDTPGSPRGVSIVAIDGLGNARGVPELLTTERFDPPVPLVAPVRHAWGAVAKRNQGFVFVASVPADGDLVDDSGVGVWFLDPPDAETAASLPTLPETRLPRPDVRIVAPSPVAGAVTALADGSIAIAFALEAPAPGEPFELYRITRDGSTTKLPPPGGLTSSPGDPHLVPFDDGFAVAWTGLLPTAPDFNPGVVEISLRDPRGNPVDPKPIEVNAIDLDEKKPMSITWAPDDRTLHVAWTRRGADGGVRVMRQRMICEAATTK